MFVNKETTYLLTYVANKQTGPITIHCAAKLSAQCNNLLGGAKYK